MSPCPTPPTGMPPPWLAGATRCPRPSPRSPGSQKTMASSMMRHGAHEPDDGAVAVFCPVTLQFQIYPISIPLQLDNAYTAELCMAWVALTARGPSADPTSVFRSSSWHFADCKG